MSDRDRHDLSDNGALERFDRLLDTIVTNGVPPDETSGLAGFAHDVHRQASVPPLSLARKQAIWSDLMAAHPSPDAGASSRRGGPALPPLPTIPASHPPRRRASFRQRVTDSRLGILPPVVLRPATIVMLAIAMTLAGVAGLAGLGQSKDPGATTPTALASEQPVIASPMPCVLASPGAAPAFARSRSASTSTPIVVHGPTATPATSAGCDPATPTPAD